MGAGEIIGAAVEIIIWYHRNAPTQTRVNHESGAWEDDSGRAAPRWR
jgi:hypothetical protein